MSDDHYKLAGTVVISEDKKPEFNRHILRILNECGIRKTEELVLDGQTITVVRRPLPDEQGIVSFDYSIFEKKKKETATYNMNTCELIAPNRGYNEFGFVMNLIMVMQEAYSEEHCYFMCEGKPCRVNTYAFLIRGVLGISLKFHQRAKVWDMFLFLKNREEYQDVTPKMVWDAYPSDFCDITWEQVFALLDTESDKIIFPKEPFKGKRSEIKETPEVKLEYYVYQIMEELVKNEGVEGLEHFLRKLLDADLEKRKKLAEDTQYGLIAEVSLYVLAPVIVHGYAAAVRQSFWDVWKNLEIKGYTEIIVKQRDARRVNEKEDQRFIPFYEAIRRDYEDEFIEFWKDEKRHFSDDMERCLLDWKERFMDQSLEDDFDMETYLAQIVIDLDQEWGCRLVDKEFITEFMEHKENNNYKKALLLYREFMDEDTWYFPELTKKQAIRWVIRDNRYRFDFTAMSAFQSLLINHKHRYEILGF